MGRNKQIYALADSALVISAETGRGGTWAGATEELKRAGRRPVFVRVGEDVPDGNRELTKLGARPFPPPPWEEDLAARLSEEQGTDSPGIAIQQSLFDDAVPRSSTPAVEEDRPDDYGRAVEAASGSVPTGVFAAVLPLLLQALPDWRSPKDVASDLEVSKTQAEDWLRRAAAEGWVERKERPVQYRRSDRSPE